MDDQIYSLIEQSLPYAAGAVAVLSLGMSWAVRGGIKWSKKAGIIEAETEQIKARAEINETSVVAEHSRKMQLLGSESYIATMKAREEEGQRQIAAYRTSGAPDGFFPDSDELRDTLDAMFPISVD